MRSKNPLPKTQRGIDALPAPPKRVEYHDTDVEGLVLRVAPSGAKTWALRYRLPGEKKHHRLTLGALSSALGLAKARSLGAVAILQARQGQDPAAAKDAARAARQAATSAMAVLEVVSLYIAECKRQKLSEVTLAEYRRMLKAYIEPAAAFVIPSATASDRDYFAFRSRYKDWLDELAEQRGQIQANRVFQLVRAAMRWAKVERLLRDNPLDGVPVPRPRAEQARVRVLSDDEIRWLLEVLDEGAPIEGAWVDADERARRTRTWAAKAAAVRTWLRCATREGETLRSGWPSVDAKLWTIPGEIRKGGRPHLVPVVPQQAAEFEALRKITGAEPRMFAGASWKKGNLHRWWKVIVALVMKKGADELQRKLVTQGPQHFTVHDLRKTASTGLGDLGVAEEVVSLVLGHAKRGVTGKHYDFSYRLNERRAALVAWAAKLDAIKAGRPAKVVPIAR